MRKCQKFIVGQNTGQMRWRRWWDLLHACDYTIALEGADVKLSELALGIGPFVVGPAVGKKNRHRRIQPVGY
jgi:methylglutaconyl-CoA hydratase